MKPVIIFGAGKRGNDCYDIIQPWNTIKYYVDNDKDKIGKIMRGKKIISFAELEAIQEDYDIVLSSNIQDIVEQLDEKGISFWMFGGSEKNYFQRKDVIDARDSYLLDQFINNKNNVQALFYEKKGNWFREDSFSEKTKNLICALKEGDLKVVDEIYEGIYGEGIFYEEDYYENRPELRLAYSLIKSYKNIQSICDMGCGYGALIQKLQEEIDTKVNIAALDNMHARVEYLKGKGIDARCEKIEENSFQDESFDVVMSFEVLEHVGNLEKTIMEIDRILRKGGKVLVTVPYGRCCNGQTHVRQFTENSLALCFMQLGYKIINVQRVPASNEDYESHIFLEAEKRMV